MAVYCAAKSAHVDMDALLNELDAPETSSAFDTFRMS